MLPETGAVVAAADVPPAQWLAVVPVGSMPVVLSPGSPGGWFGGRAVVAWGPVEHASGLTRADAAAVLERAERSHEPVLAVALLPYDAAASAAVYDGGLVAGPAGWRVWGSLRPEAVPPVSAASLAMLPADAPLARALETDLDAAAFRSGVRGVAEAIRAGDVYVLNLTRRITGAPVCSPREAFAALVERTAADMAAYWEGPGSAIASASPERFVRIADGCAHIQPIKGTRPRAAGRADDALAAELGASEKERSEHVMIVDLERNDLGRVCHAGTVSVDPLFEVVSTPYCHQLVSTVTGHLRGDASIGDVLAATFPCGSVTGAPKIAAMRAVESLEASARGAYTGSLVVGMPGTVDSSVLIRTAEYAGGVVRWGTGGGITVDSDPAEEWLETVLKASPFTGDGYPPAALRETCRVTGGRVPLLARHLARLAAGGCGPSLLAAVREAASRSLGEPDAAGMTRLALTVTPDGVVTAEPGDAPSSLHVPGGPVPYLVVSDVPVLPPGAAKPADRAPWDAAQRAALAAGAHQAVLVDRAGRVIDGATATVWVRTGTCLTTPPAPPAVDGVARGVVLDLAESFGYRAVEGGVTAAVLETADEVFFTNALAGVVAARGRGGAAAAALGAAFEELCRG